MQAGNKTCFDGQGYLLVKGPWEKFISHLTIGDKIIVFNMLISSF